MKATVKEIMERRPDLWEHGRDMGYSLFSMTFTLYGFSYDNGVQILATNLTADEAKAHIEHITKNGSGGSR